jgi:hypothetical protein
VKKTQTLWFLADIYLGDGERWREIWALNPQIEDPDLILPGMKVKMPKAITEQGPVDQQNVPQQNAPQQNEQGEETAPPEASQHNPDGVFFFNELGGELQPYYRARCMDNGNSDTAYQAEQLEGLELAIGEDYAFAELQTSPDSKGLVIDWEASVASRPVGH